MKKPPSRNILLACKARHERATALGEEIGTWLRRQGHRATVITAEQDSPAYGQEDLDFVVVLGGDGTMLGVARRLVGRGVPVLGINFGRVGFLTDAQPDQWQDKLVECLYGDEPVRACMALTWSVTRQGGVLASGHGVNDVVLSRGSLARLVSMEIAVNGVRMGALRSDGVIVCTPIGSSGYSVSAGGPLLYPSMEALGFVPICPFLNTIAPMVFDGNTSLTMEILHGSTDCYLTADGQEGMLLERGDVVRVGGLPAAVQFMGEGTCFFERLRSRGFVLQGAPGGLGGGLA